MINIITPFFVGILIMLGAPVYAVSFGLYWGPDSNKGFTILENVPYQKLLHEFYHYRDIAAAGGWPFIPSGPALRPGDRDKRISILRARLAISGDLVQDGRHYKEAGDSELFDKGLREAVVRFQMRHGLEPDGVVGRNTLDELNVAVEDRIRQIRVNLERFRLFLGLIEDRYIVINIPDFELRLIEGGKTVMRMKIIVGRSDRQTPVFSSEITSIVVNPYWRVPYSIAVKDILPEIQKHPDYLDKKHIKVINTSDDSIVDVFADKIDWKKVSERNFSYKLRQDPGADNALGRLKFNISNRYDIYLHDTPAQGLFKRTRRDFSSGCIRLERPLELALYLLSDHTAWTREKLLDLIKAGKTITIRLKKPIPVHIEYFTAWVADDGVLNFRRDIYGRDAMSDSVSRK
ncbi:MAG: L,D-transpeptidase family protein [Dissulfurimicrobium sp.]|uniref:L,D-transpeptidase family protein n=2 Tax=Dissulfurimicrobium TaxID=1769732 RepID=UPI003C71AF8B